MQVDIWVDGRSLRQFHVDLARRLSAFCDVSVQIEPAGTALPLPSGTELMFTFEQMTLGLPARKSAAIVPPTALAPYLDAKGPPDLVLDLVGVALPGRAKVWQLTYDGAFGDAGLLASLMQRRAPLAVLREGARPIAAGRLGTETNGTMLPSFEDALVRVTSLIVAAVSGSPNGAELAGDPTPRLPGNREIAAFCASGLARKIVRRLYSLCFRAPHWRVGWRRLNGPDLIDLQQHPATGWTDLADDGKRFYADPFPILHQGKVTLFVEDFIHSLGKGIISAVEFGPDGPLGQPQPVLELPYHLSYPFVFEREGEIWMVPESCAVGTIDLFRATRFPGGWVKEATLVDKVIASDTTLLEHQGRWWMFATDKSDGGSYSDALHIWSAPDFRGPWTAHAHNPVLIDIGSARPAGRIVKRNGELWRPVQDCRRGYGHGLALARITQLDDQAFTQKVEAILTAGPLWPGRRLHSLNEAGGIEFIDGSASPRRFF